MVLESFINDHNDRCNTRKQQKEKRREKLSKESFKQTVSKTREAVTGDFFIPDFSLVKSIHETVIDARKEDSRGGYWHPSQMHYMCPRGEILQRLLNIRQDAPDLNLQTKFDVGHSLHAYLQYVLLKSGILIPNPNSKAITQPISDIIFSDDYSFLYGAFEHITSLAEYPVRIDEYNIKGRCDGIFEVNGTKHVLEIKTAGPKWWVKKSVQPSYITQASLYCEALGTDYFDILFLDKAGTNNLPYFEVVKEKDCSAVKNVFDKIEIFNNHSEAHTLPSKSIYCEQGKRGFMKSRCPVSSWCMDASECTKLLKKWDDEDIIVKV